jgi:hypothetical protein
MMFWKYYIHVKWNWFKINWIQYLKKIVTHVYKLFYVQCLLVDVCDNNLRTGENYTLYLEQ